MAWFADALWRVYRRLGGKDLTPLTLDWLMDYQALDAIDEAEAPIVMDEGED